MFNNILSEFLKFLKLQFRFLQFRFLWFQFLQFRFLRFRFLQFRFLQFRFLQFLKIRFRILSIALNRHSYINSYSYSSQYKTFLIKEEYKANMYHPFIIFENMWYTNIVYLKYNFYTIKFLHLTFYYYSMHICIK